MHYGKYVTGQGGVVHYGIEDEIADGSTKSLVFRGLVCGADKNYKRFGSSARRLHSQTYAVDCKRCLKIKGA